MARASSPHRRETPRRTNGALTRGMVRVCCPGMRKKIPEHVLWAPWRLEYVKRPREDGCFLCAAFRSRADRENGVVIRGRHCAVVLNRYPYTGGHLMVAPLRHIGDLKDLRASERKELLDLTLRSVELLRGKLSPQGFNIGLNLGEAAGAGLEDHLHVHVVPRWRGDTNFMPVVGRVRVTPVSLGALWDLLHEKPPTRRARKPAAPKE